MEVLLLMPSSPRDDRKCVLIVDQSDDSRDVIRTVLERRGVRILEAPEAGEGLDILREFHPEVVVLDAESGDSEDSRLRAAFDAEVAHTNAELVILGNVRREDLPHRRHFIPKPYHYGPLIRKIEQLAGRSTPTP